MDTDNKTTVINKLKDICSLKSNVPLSDYTTFKTGGNAEYFIEPDNDKEIANIMSLIKGNRYPCTVIGGGSNLLISDQGLPGIVIKISDNRSELKVEDGLIYASAFMQKEKFIDEAISNGFGGVKFMAGVPGSVGGGIYMNAGTFMGCFIDVLRIIRILDTDCTIREIPVKPEDSGYRKMNVPEDSLILGGYFDLPSDDNSELLKNEIKDIVDDRWSKHPMEYPSAGSVFKNPQGHSSWKLVNDCGLKGFSIGGASVSEKHTNFIINKSGATSSDIFNLINHVRDSVFEKFGIRLETEIKILGKF